MFYNDEFVIYEMLIIVILYKQCYICCYMRNGGQIKRKKDKEELTIIFLLMHAIMQNKL